MNNSVSRSFFLFLLLGFAGIVNANVITFEEFAADNNNGPMPAGRYAGLGVTFVATDDGTTWGGISLGDPGNWGIDGTNGSIFSGFNGDSDGLGMLFSSVISNFSLDTSRSNGSANGDTFTLDGYLNNVLLDSVTITFGNINVWSTVALANSYDEIRFYGTGNGFNPFGVDNIRWNAVETPEPMTLALMGLGLFGLGLSKRKKV